MNKQTAKLTIREIKGSFGRYMAIFAIIALGADSLSACVCQSRTL